MISLRVVRGPGSAAMGYLRSGERHFLWLMWEFAQGFFVFFFFFRPSGFSDTQLKFQSSLLTLAVEPHLAYARATGSYRISVFKKIKINLILSNLHSGLSAT